MNTMLGIPALIGALAIFGGCAATPAVISDLEEDKVVVRSGLGTSLYDIADKAGEGCALHGRWPHPVSRTCLDEYCIRKEYLFACRTP